jgi:hypothetical protein
MLMVWTYAAYLVISLGLAVYVAHTLHKNGRVFLVDSFGGNEQLADSVNHLLVVGFYLINLGYISLVLKYGDPARTLQEAIEYLSWKVGFVAVVLGVVHFVNVLVFSRMRHRATERVERRRRSWDELPEVLPAGDGRRR